MPSWRARNRGSGILLPGCGGRLWSLLWSLLCVLLPDFPKFQNKNMRRRRLTKVRFGPYFEDQKLGPGPTFPQNLGPIRAQIPGKIEGQIFPSLFPSLSTSSPGSATSLCRPPSSLCFSRSPFFLHFMTHSCNCNRFD